MEATAVSTDSGAATTGSTAPSTFAEAFARDASSASTPDSASQTTDQSAGTTAPPADSSTPSGQPQQTGEPPQERWADILSNARQKAAAEAWAGYEWAKQVTPQQFQEMAKWYQSANSDPVAFVQNLIGELQAHPDHGAKLRSLAAKTLSSGRSQQQAASEMPQPDVAITDPATGQVVGHTYSNKALAERDTWLRQQIVAEIEQKYAPVTKTVEQITAERAELTRRQEAAAFARDFQAELAALPGYTEHRDAIRAELERAQLKSDHPAEVSAAAFRAYLKVVQPTLTQKAKSQLLDDLQQKAAASTGINPGSAAPAALGKVNSFHDPRLKW